MVEAAAPAVGTIVGGGWVITVDAERRIFRHGGVAIAGDRIVEVGQHADLVAAHPQARVIDTTDMVVTPGLINAHRHVLATPKGAQPDGQVTLGNLPGFVYPSFAALTEDDMHAYTLHATAEMIRFGTTTFEEPGCQHLESVLDALAASGMRCRVGPWTWDQGGPPAISGNCPDWLRLSTPDAIKRLEWGIETVRAFGHPLIDDAVTMEGVGSCSDELHVAGARLAAEADSLCVTHKATSENEVRIELEHFGHRPLEHLYRIGAMNEHVLLSHVTSLELFEVDYFVDTGARISQNPSSALKLTKGTTQTGKWPELLAAGVPIGLGTDGENASNHADICRAMYLAALLPRDARRDPNAVTAEQAVEMATIGGATALRLDDRIGSLEAGKQADLVAFDTRDFDWRPLHNPVANLVYGATGYSVHTVLIAGQVVLDAGRHTRIDLGTVREAAERTDRRILAEIGVDPLPAWPVF